MRPPPLLVSTVVAIAATACSGSFESSGLPGGDADTGVPQADGAPTSNGRPLPTPGSDEDADGLDDAWESAAGDLSRLDPTRSDTDGNGVPDGDEDPDGDGLTTAMEFALSTHVSASGVVVHPLRRDLFVELDEMAGTSVSDTVLANTAAAFSALPNPVGLLIFRDESGIAATNFDGSFEQRHAFLESHGPMLAAPLPVAQMIHVAVVTRRTDEEFRGGEVVTHGEGDIDKTGVLIFYDALADLHPQCGLDGDPPDITLDEALSSAIAHEIVNVLQLGHESDAGGGTNYFNIMSVPGTCNEAQQRFHGDANTDATLGATAGVGSRFSAEAAALMRFDQRLSVDTAELINDGRGQEM